MPLQYNPEDHPEDYNEADAQAAMPPVAMPEWLREAVAKRAEERAQRDQQIVGNAGGGGNQGGGGFDPQPLPPQAVPPKKAPEKKRFQQTFRPFDLSSVYVKKPRVIYLLRGVPGGGKTTLAQILDFAYRKWGLSLQHYEADQFLINPETGNYELTPERLAEAHEACQKSVEDAMKLYGAVIAVSNPFITRAHLEPYLRMAKKYDYTPFEIICRGTFDNVHDVP